MGFGGAFLLKNNFNVIAIKGNVDRWYQDLPAEALEAVNKFLTDMPDPPHWRASYGSSMGGYAAFMFAKDLHVDLALAISPQFDVTAQWDRRWASHIDGPMRVLDGNSIGSGCTYITVYDPRDADHLHFERLAAAIPAEQLIPIKLPYSGHPSGHVLVDAGKLQEVALRALDGDIKSVRPRDVIKATHKTAHYLYILADHCIRRKHLRWADSLMSIAVAKRPLDAEYNIRAAIIADRRGQIERAINHAAVAVATTPKHPHMNMILGRLLRQKGQNAAALHYMDAAVALAPTIATALAQEREELRHQMQV